MRVMCIREATSISKGADYIPKVGDINEVVDTRTKFGELFYVLERSKKFMYMADLFAPLSEIDETEMVREYNLQQA